MAVTFRTGILRSKEDAIIVFLGLFSLFMGVLYIFDSIRLRHHSATLDLLI